MILPRPKNNGTSSFGSHTRDAEAVSTMELVLMWGYCGMVAVIGGLGKRGGAEIGKSSTIGFVQSNRVSFTMRFVIKDCWVVRDF